MLDQFSNSGGCKKISGEVLHSTTRGSDFFFFESRSSSRIEVLESRNSSRIDVLESSAWKEFYHENVLYISGSSGFFVHFNRSMLVFFIQIVLMIWYIHWYFLSFQTILVPPIISKYNNFNLKITILAISHEIMSKLVIKLLFDWR